MHRRSSISWILSLSVVFLGAIAQAEQVTYVDSARNVFVVDTEDPNHPFRLDPKGPTKSYQKQNITFNVTFQDVEDQSGIGFDDPTRGAEFRNRLDDVFTYLDSILGHTATVDVLMDASENDTQGNTLASAGPFYPSAPALSNGAAFDRITTGVKPQAGVPEIISQVNFGVDWYTGTGTPGPNQFDFFEVLLHEMGHGLGLAGLLNETGESDLPGVFTVWDVLTQNGMSQELVTAGNGSPSFVGMVSDLTASNLFFTGALSVESLGERPPIYAPNPYQQGSSLSHFDDERITAQTALMGPASFRGTSIREFAPFELGTLQDLGYTLAGMTMPMEPAISVNPTALTDVAAAGVAQQVMITNTGAGTLSWTIASSDTWITLSAAAGIGPGTVMVTVAENTTGAARAGSITVTDPNATNSPVTIAVNQLANVTMTAPVISVTPSVLTDIPAAAGTQQIMITNTGTGTLSWTAVSSVPWITVSPASGMGPGTLTLSIQENIAPNTDTGTITITDPNATNSPVTITVTQLGSTTEGGGCAAGMFGRGTQRGGANTADILLVLATVAGLVSASKLRRSQLG